MGHASVQATRDFYAVFKRDELRRKHNEFSAVAKMARGEGFSLERSVGVLVVVALGTGRAYL
jgi:hypothetical protein